MKREFRLNDRSFSRDPSGPLVTLSTYVKFSQSGGKTRQVSLRPSRSFKRNYAFIYGRSKWKRDLDCISSRKFLQCSSFGELLFCSSRRRRGKSKWFDPQISFCEFKHKQYRGRIVIRVYFHVWGNPYITEINRLFKVKAENQHTPDLGFLGIIEGPRDFFWFWLLPQFNHPRYLRVRMGLTVNWYLAKETVVNW